MKLGGKQACFGENTPFLVFPVAINHLLVRKLYSLFMDLPQCFFLYKPFLIL